MKKFFLLIQILSIVLISTSISKSGQTNFLDQGISLFEKKKFDKSKIFFEKDIVFNPKSEKSYLYLSKIFNKQEKKDLEEKNLNTVILLNPRNEEAVFNLAKLKLEKSDFSESKKLIENNKVEGQEVIEGVENKIEKKINDLDLSIVETSNEMNEQILLLKKRNSYLLFLINSPLA